MCFSDTCQPWLSRCPANMELSSTHMAPSPLRILMNFKELCRTVVLCYTPGNIKAGLSKLKSIPKPRECKHSFSAVWYRIFCNGGNGAAYLGWYLDLWWWFPGMPSEVPPPSLSTAHYCRCFFLKNPHLPAAGASCRNPGFSKGCRSLHFPTTFVLLPFAHVLALCFFLPPWDISESACGQVFTL